MLQPAHADTAGCDDWAARRTSIGGFAKFFEIESEHRDNLVGNFNLVPPRTHIAPDMVGYSWGGGSDFARLYMVRDGCLLVERLYPMMLVWQMMGSYPAVPADLDKSSARYLQEQRERQELQWKLAEQALEAERLASDAEISDEQEDTIFDAIGTAGPLMEDME